MFAKKLEKNCNYAQLSCPLAENEQQYLRYMPNKLKTILLEDDMVARMILENYCSNHPSIEFVKDFDDIAEAIDYINTHPVDLIFLDIQLKNSSGFDLLQHVPSTTKVIITTSDSDNIEKAHSYHIDNILIKPITLESFLWSIKKLSDWLLTVEKLKQ